ncbi:MAG: polyprenyl synthetase family protein [Clostridia bacterium]|nr:polyprenyl synthetase family protein [Clostridia bacterium]
MSAEQMSALIERRLQAYLSDARIPPHLAEVMAYSVMAGGKRLRPRMLLAACDMLHGDVERALPLACAIEMIHTYSLIHDDLPCMDNDDYRRGKPTNHKVYGEGFAVLAGDGLLSYAFEIMLEAALANANDSAYLKAVDAVAKGAGVHGMVAGQACDLVNERQPAGDAQTLRHIHENKTGAMLKAAVCAGGYAAGGDETAIRALEDFGTAYGLLFQITDDILDVEGDFARMGKTLGKDASADKLTYVRLFGLETAREKAQAAACDARAALAVFEDRAAFFLALIDQTLARKS